MEAGRTQENKGATSMTALVFENLAVLPFYARSLWLLLARLVRALDNVRMKLFHQRVQAQKARQN
jgi:hypothetical protein